MLRFHLIEGDSPSSGGYALNGSSFRKVGGKRCMLVGDSGYCATCKTLGVIVGAGPRRRDADGARDAALSGDLCRCQCRACPVMISSQTLFKQTLDGFPPRHAGEPEISNANAPSVSETQFDELAVATCRARGSALAGYPYYIAMADGRVFQGYTDDPGRLPRIQMDNADEYSVLWGDEALVRHEGVN
jgi:uncharacterized Zn-binding protein involved in type VI secretion